MKDIEYYRLNFFENDLPVPYELSDNTTCYIHPITVKNYNLYNFSKRVMEVQKNETNDIKIIQMSYLDFVVNILFNLEDGEIYKDNFINLMTLILHKEFIGVNQIKGKCCVVAMDNNNDQNALIIKAKELDEIVKISFYQNDPKYKDRYLSPDVRTEIEAYCRLKYGDTHTPTLEEQKAFVISKTGILMKDINEMTYRNFILVYNACKDSEIYIAQKIIQGSYKYDVKKDIQHPLYVEDGDIIDEVFSTSAEQFENKISQVNG